MKNKHNGGFSLVEVLVSMVILAVIVIPTCTSLVLSFRLNENADDLMHAQLAVSSTVEALMAEGITDGFLKGLMREGEQGAYYYTSTDFPGIVFGLEDKGDYYAVTVADCEEQVSADTSVRDNTVEISLEEVAVK